jgi:hypothetical protein
VSTHPVTICPPSSKFGWGRPQYDRHQFAGRRAKAVSATKNHDGTFDSTGLSFSDYQGSMHVMRREKQQIRRLATPEWAMSDEQTAEMILKYLEYRNYVRDTSGCPAERLARVDEEAKKRIPAMRVKLSDLLARHQRAKDDGVSAEGIRRIEIQIQNTDSQIVIAERGEAALVAAAVYYYHRFGWDSTTVAEELGLKAPQVRIWLYRLGRIADGRRANENKWAAKKQAMRDKGCSSWAPADVRRLFILKASGATLRQCAKALDRTGSTITRMWQHSFGDLKVGLLTPGRASKRSYVPRPKLKKWTEEKIRLLFIMRTTGKTVTDCATAFRCKADTIRQVWRKCFGHLNLKIRTARKIPCSSGHPRGSKVTWTPERVAQLAALRKDGKPWEECRQAMGLRHVNTARAVPYRFPQYFN